MVVTFSSCIFIYEGFSTSQGIKIRGWEGIVSQFNHFKIYFTKNIDVLWYPFFPLMVDKGSDGWTWVCLCMYKAHGESNQNADMAKIKIK